MTEDALPSSDDIQRFKHETVFLLPGIPTMVVFGQVTIRFVATYVIVTAVTDRFEYFRSSYRAASEQKNRSLHTEIDKRIPAEKEKEKVIQILERALRDVKTLKGLLPICRGFGTTRDTGNSLKAT